MVVFTCILKSARTENVAEVGQELRLCSRNPEPHCCSGSFWKDLELHWGLQQQAQPLLPDFLQTWGPLVIPPPQGLC